jgi:cytoskeletal protein RodZ
MNLHRSFLPFAAPALASMLALGGCKTAPQQASNQPTNNPNTQPQNPQQASSPSAAAPTPSSAQSSSPGSAPASSAAAPSTPQAPPPPAVVDLPVGTRIRVRLDQDLGSKISQPGDSFTATVADDVVVNGQTVIAKGARADGTVIDSKPLGRFKGGA